MLCAVSRESIRQYDHVSGLCTSDILIDLSDPFQYWTTLIAMLILYKVSLTNVLLENPGYKEIK